MAHFAIHIMDAADVAGTPIRRPVPFNCHGFDAETHEAAFFNSSIQFEPFPQLAKLRMPCAFILERYVAEDLDDLLKESNELAQCRELGDALRSVFVKLADCCRRAMDENKAILCTGD